jgi:hypothetical protein
MILNFFWGSKQSDNQINEKEEQFFLSKQTKNDDFFEQFQYSGVYIVNLVFHRLVQLNKGVRGTQSRSPLIFYPCAC